MASERRRAIRTTLVALVLVASPSLAHADPTAAEKESARNHMQQGDAQRDKGEKEAALKSYEAADAIMHVPTTGLEVARMQAALGLLLEARETLARVAKLPAKANEPAPFVAARKAAAELANDVNTRLPSLAVVIANADPAHQPTLMIDNETVPVQGADVHRKMNPGKHVVVARAGQVEKREEITLGERDQKTATFDLKPPPVAPPPPPEPPPPNGLAKPLLYGGFALAIVGVGVGSVTGLMSIARVNDVKPQCEGGTRCPASTASDIDTAKTLGTISTVAFIAGGVGVGLGVAGLLMSKGDKSGSEPTPSASHERAKRAWSVTAEPVIGPTWAGVRGVF